MNSINKIFSKITAVIVTLLLLAACSSTSLINRWNDPDFKGPALKKILVIGIIKDDIKRRSFEDQFRKLITAGERVGVASYTLMPNLQNADKKDGVLAVG